MATLVTSLLFGSSAFFLVRRAWISNLMSSNFDQMPQLTMELHALRSEKAMNNVVVTLASSFLIGSSSFLRIIRTCIIAWMS